MVVSGGEGSLARRARVVGLAWGAPRRPSPERLTSFSLDAMKSATRPTRYWYRTLKVASLWHDDAHRSCWRRFGGSGRRLLTREYGGRLVPSSGPRAN